jgi:RNA-directed DNA polymerase
MDTVSRFITQKLKLKVNANKSAVAAMSCRKFLGFTISCGEKKTIRRIAPVSIQRFKDKIRILTAEYKGVSINQAIKDLSRYLRGWIGYYGLCQTPSVLEALEQ